MVWSTRVVPNSIFDDAQTFFFFFFFFYQKKNKKREKRLEAFGSIPTRCAGTERSHNSFLLALKSRVIVVSKERRRKAKTLGLLALQKSYLFRCFFALRARQPFRHQSSQHFLLSLSSIFTSAVSVSRGGRD